MERLTLLFHYFGRSTIKRSLSDDNILCESDTTIRDMGVTICKHSSGKTDELCLSESPLDIFTCGSDICHCRYCLIGIVHAVGVRQATFMYWGILTIS